MQGHITQSDLIEQGWTVGLIDRFLGRPDQTVDNPRGPHPIRLYALHRVEIEEGTPEWRAAFAALRERRERRARPSSSTKPAGPKRAKVEPAVVEFGFGDAIPLRKRRARPGGAA